MPSLLTMMLTNRPHAPKLDNFYPPAVKTWVNRLELAYQAAIQRGVHTADKEIAAHHAPAWSKEYHNRGKQATSSSISRGAELHEYSILFKN